TLTGLAAAAGCGVVAALYGRTRLARLVGWLVTASAGHLLAMVAGLIAGLPVYWSAFLVAGVASTLLVLAALLPQLRRPDAITESTTVEASSYAGAVLALLLASRSLPHLAIFCTIWGAVLGIAASRPGRARVYRSVLIWFAAAHEVVAWWLLMRISHVALTEAYTLAVAVVALITGYVEYRRHPEISSWYAFGIALVAAFLPSLTILLATGQTPLRLALLMLGSAGTVAYGSMRRQQAPVVVGGVVLTIAALYEVAVLSSVAAVLVVMAIVATVLVSLGATYEKRRRNIQRLRGAIGRLR
ncbi:MAG TPA: permease, partial [Rugosimonospora sp.]|nr:permease [Rugosimonospora sp.]